MSQQLEKRLLLTGATGFIGRYLLEAAIAQGYEVWCAVRQESNARLYDGMPVHLLSVDFAHTEQMREAFSSVPRPDGEAPFHYIIHNAGITKTTDTRLFREANAENTRRLLEALNSFPQQPTRFVLMSSMGSYGLNSSDEPMSSAHKQQPHTEYGRSKLLAEQYTLASGIPCTILQPTGVYGYGDKDYWITVDTMLRGWSFLSGLRPQRLSYVYVRDLVAAAFFLMKHPEAVGKRFIISDGNDYSDNSFTEICSGLLDKRIYTLRMPLPIIYLGCLVGEIYGRVRHEAIALNLDKYPIIKQRNWTCDNTPLCALGFEPKYDLRAGLTEAFRLAGLL